MYFLKHKGAVCKNLSPSEFILRTNRLQYITRVTTNCSCNELLSSFSRTASGSEWEWDQGSVSVFNASTGAVEQEEPGPIS